MAPYCGKGLTGSDPRAMNYVLRFIKTSNDCVTPEAVGNLWATDEVLVCHGFHNACYISRELSIGKAIKKNSDPHLFFLIRNELKMTSIG